MEPQGLDEEAVDSGARVDVYDEWIRAVLGPKLEDCRNR